MTERGTLLAGRYLLRERVGAGGMGEVWRATDEVLNRTVAVKLVLPALVDEPGFVRRFLAEARAMASVRHPGVVAIHDFHGDADGAFLVMEFVAGEPLSRVLGRVGRLGPTVAMDLVRQAALALQAVHERGVVHRDVKPANLLLRPDGTLALTDFGIAQTADVTALTASGAILGTPSYLAPEQVLGQAATPLSDVYALGVVAYECLAGRRPFIGDNPFAVAMQRVAQAPPPLTAPVPPAVAAVVERALAPDPARRWASAAEFAAAAGAGRAGLPPSHPVSPVPVPVAVPATAGPPVPPASTGSTAARPGRRRWAVALAALAVVVVATTIALVVASRHPGGTGAAASGGGGVPAGFVACGDLLCPTAPMCWHGLNDIGDTAEPPGRSVCTEPHYWETFAALRLPADAASGDLTQLMQRPDIAAACSEQTLAAHSRDAAQTRGWRREAWPIPVDAYTVLVHCLGGSPDGETPGAVFTAG